MGVYRFYPTKDTTIVNGEKVVAASSSNMGASEILQMFATSSDYGPQTSSILIAFNTATMPATGTATASFVLKMFDAAHAETIPYGYYATVRPLEQTWDEGRGHDFDYYLDEAAANWLSSSDNTLWATPGAVPSGSSSSSFFFEDGHEDMEVDVTDIVAREHGFLVAVAYGYDKYVKKFHSRQTHFKNKRPFLEVRWNDATGSLSTYQAFLIESAGPWSGSYLDRWDFTGSMSGTLVDLTRSTVDPTGTLLFKIPNLKTVYDTTEITTLRLDVFPKDWNLAAGGLPYATAITASTDASGAVLLDAYHRVVDDLTGDELIPFGTGSTKHTKLSYDDRGNYFTLYMSSLPPGRLCRLDFGWNSGSVWNVQTGLDLKFRTR